MSNIQPFTADQYDVHLGFWTNWSYGKVRGATITLTRNNGSLLIAFLALFVGAAGTSFWRLLCFALHQIFSDPTTPKDGFHHQRQAILRNSETAFLGGWKILGSAATWKRNHAAQRIIRRSVPLAAVGIVISCGFAVAGIFASRVTDENENEVLLSGSKCGQADREIDYITFHREYTPWSARRSKEFLSYGQSCSNNNTRKDGCNLYVKPTLSITSNRNATCPFDEEICLSKYGNIEVDTGYIDTHSDLGINANPNNRFFTRNIYRCATLKTENYSKIVNVIDSKHNNQTVPTLKLFYGRHAGDLHSPGYDNFTYQFPINLTYLHYGSGMELTGPSPDYFLGSRVAYDNPAFPISAPYTPIKQLQRNGNDLIMMYLSAPELLFSEPVDDPWFAAHRPGSQMYGSNTGQNKGISRYKDDVVSTVGCQRQVQWCLSAPKEPDGRRCEPLRGVIAPIAKIGTDEENKKLAAMEEYTTATQNPIEQLLLDLGPSLLVAQYSIGGGQQGPLPPDQWQIEVENMVRTNLASIQGSIVDRVRGPATPEIAKIWSLADNPTLQAICNSQKILSTKYPSFNVLGLSLIFGIGALVIMLDFLLEPAIKSFRIHMGRIQSRQTRPDDVEKSSGKLPDTARRTETAQSSWDSKMFKHTEWSMTSTLQLQRLAHEGVGAGTWARTASEYPITAPNQSLGVMKFKVAPHGHPYLMAPEAVTQQGAYTQVKTPFVGVDEIAPTPTNGSRVSTLVPVNTEDYATEHSAEYKKNKTTLRNEYRGDVIDHSSRRT